MSLVVDSKQRFLAIGLVIIVVIIGFVLLAMKIFDSSAQQQKAVDQFDRQQACAQSVRDIVPRQKTAGMTTCKSESK